MARSREVFPEPFEPTKATIVPLIDLQRRIVDDRDAVISGLHMFHLKHLSYLLPDRR